MGNWAAQGLVSEYLLKIFLQDHKFLVFKVLLFGLFNNFLAKKFFENPERLIRVFLISRNC